ncbi:histidine phosphatase family protein [Bradyrhizobium sp. LHD-71]|uniref:histidine phosphatase family protein n=1 Tax=Bradyrhizobium sp. LHD-71 TaxID=3072141 RepID=UPI00280EA37D|nr:histidine phosphatase family protein [Bradyrhizobium sp. LHD-71]MDQ8729913.1 histidine phosphatase family protein [Bradyrhizobium sp. LHD-71]
MATLYLVRHAKPASAYGDSLDPGLDEVGAAQAVRAAEELQALPNRLPLYTSPLRRCRETARPLAEAWGVQPIVLAEIGEVPSPPLSLKERQEWLRKAMTSDWANLQATAPAGSPDYAAWRSTLLDAVRAMAGDAVIFSHFIAINVVVGAAVNSEQVLSFRPDHASVTIVDVSEGDIAIRALGREVGSGEAGVLLGR